jgi:hypothetical protein
LLAPLPAKHSTVLTADDQGVVVQWAAPSGAPGAAPPVALQRFSRAPPGARPGAGAVPCAAVGLVAGAVAAAAFADGAVRLFRLRAPGAPAGSGFMEAEAAAHAGAAMALAVHPSLPLFATAGQDGVVCVWLLPELGGAAGGAGADAGAASGPGKAVGKVVLSAAVRISNAALTGVAFAKQKDGGGAPHLVVAAYDDTALRVIVAR